MFGGAVDGDVWGEGRSRGCDVGHGAFMRRERRRSGQYRQQGGTPPDVPGYLVVVQPRLTVRYAGLLAVVGMIGTAGSGAFLLIVTVFVHTSSVPCHPGLGGCRGGVSVTVVALVAAVILAASLRLCLAADRGFRELPPAQPPDGAGSRPR